MNTIDLDGLYAVYNSENDEVCNYANNGIVYLYGHYMEAEERCDEHQTPIHCTDLSPRWKQIIIKQIESIEQQRKLW